MERKQRKFGAITGIPLRKVIPAQLEALIKTTFQFVSMKNQKRLKAQRIGFGVLST